MDEMELVLEETRHEELLNAIKELFQAIKSLEASVVSQELEGFEGVKSVLQSLSAKMNSLSISPGTLESIMNSTTNIKEALIKPVPLKEYMITVTARDNEENIKELKITQNK